MRYKDAKFDDIIWRIVAPNKIINNYFHIRLQFICVLVHFQILVWLIRDIVIINSIINVIYFFLSILFCTYLKIPKVVIKNRKSKKDRQHNGQKKKDRQCNGQKKKDRRYNGQKKKEKMTNNDLQNTTQKTKDWEKRTPQYLLFFTSYQHPL